MRHEVKIWPKYFDVVADGTMTHNLRRNDRGYLAGDEILMREWIEKSDPTAVGIRNTGEGHYTGREILAKITHVMEREGAGWRRDITSMGLSPTFAILSLKVITVTANAKREDNATAA